MPPRPSVPVSTLGNYVFAKNKPLFPGRIVECLVIGGGGGGGGVYTGAAYGSNSGGGAGGMLELTNFFVPVGAPLTVTVGIAGLGRSTSTAKSAYQGGDSVFHTVTAWGGCGGHSGYGQANISDLRYEDSTPRVEATGFLQGSGSGGVGFGSAGRGGQGNYGGRAYNGYAGSGGGGAGGNGGTSNTGGNYSLGGVGGVGRSSSMSGSSVAYCGGGQGGNSYYYGAGTTPANSTGGGGACSGSSNGAAGGNATNYGSGGGAGSANGSGVQSNGGNGFQGLVIVRWLQTAGSTATSTTGSPTYSSANSYHTYTWTSTGTWSLTI